MCVLNVILEAVSCCVLKVAIINISLIMMHLMTTSKVKNVACSVLVQYNFFKANIYLPSF